MTPTLRHAGTALALSLVLAGCALDQPRSGSPLSSPASASVPASVPIDPAATAVAPAPTVDRATPGRPYGPEEILAAMQDSHRPGGIPQALQVESVAARIADQAWTWDGQPWESLGVTGACGPLSCSLDLAGSRQGGDGTDLYSFTIDPASGAVALVATDLHGYPARLDAHLDARARGALGTNRLSGMALVGARWLPPPDTDRYWLAYRSGGEEGSQGLDLLLDLGSGQVLDLQDAG